MRFVKIPAILSAGLDQSWVAIRKRRKKSRDNSYCYATVNNYARILTDSLHFGVCVCVTLQSHQGLGKKQEINFAEETVLTRFTTRVIMIWEIMR